MTDAPRFELETTPDGGTAVWEVLPVWRATFAEEGEARAYVAWQQAQQDAVARYAAAGRSGGAAGLMGEAGPEAILPLRRGPGGRLGVEADDPPAVKADLLATCLICGIDVAAPCTNTASAAACAHYAEHGDLLGAPEPDAETEPEDLPEDDDAALAALSAMETHSPVVEITLIPAPADPTGGDPYHEAGEAFRRLKAGEQLGAVADELRLRMPVLRSRWARYQQALKVAGWQPGATVAKPAESPLAEGWACCTACRTKFNAARAQADAKLPSRPTLCAACRGR